MPPDQALVAGGGSESESAESEMPKQDLVPCGGSESEGDEGESVAGEAPNSKHLEAALAVFDPEDMGSNKGMVC